MCGDADGPRGHVVDVGRPGDRYEGVAANGKVALAMLRVSGVAAVDVSGTT